MGQAEGFEPPQGGPLRQLQIRDHLFDGHNVGIHRLFRESYPFEKIREYSLNLKWCIAAYPHALGLSWLAALPPAASLLFSKGLPACPGALRFWLGSEVSAVPGARPVYPSKRH